MSAKRICIEKAKQISDVGDKDEKVVINSLDYDSLAKIIMLLPIPERIDMEEVCIKWKEACRLAWYNIKEYKCESSIGRSYDNRVLTQSYLQEILLRCGIYLKKLSLSDVCNSKIMPFIGDHCKNLTSLECKFSIDSLNDFANDFVQLTELENLECLMLDVLIELHEESIIAISNNCKKLKRLEIPYCNIVSSIDGEPLLSSSVLYELSKLQYLEHLSLRYTISLKDSTIIAIANNCKNLRSLNIESCNAITETALVALTNLKNLQNLNLYFTKGRILLIDNDEFLRKL
ncbi:F-box/LRR-repeat protein 3-like [Aphidius gifuensis]|uniref:F-box/LRR-repeat protein 3-like n=1 Tax=Aphidius gifuensis TaxID=684658 RepID=UPI001CDC13AB|nr:F-box/LRR-repeat protein 3-like [Aphidius gifuensis]